MNFLLKFFIKEFYEEFNVHGSVHRNHIRIYIQQDATLHSLRVYYLETVLHILGGTSTHHQERKQLYLQHLVFVTPLQLPAAIASFLDHTQRRTTVGKTPLDE
jgi:hypothetical protein